MSKTPTIRPQAAEMTCAGQDDSAGARELPVNDKRSMSIGSSQSTAQASLSHKDSFSLRKKASPTTTPTKAAPADKSRSIVARCTHACLNLPPSFFSINMGTGITSILLYNFPYPAHWLRIVGTIIFVLNIAVFCLLALGNIARYIKYRGVFGATVTHPLAGLFWGTLPMGLATIVNMVAYVCVPTWGRRWAQLALGLWWIDAVLSVAVNLGMVFSMFTRQTQTPETMSAAWLLPIVSSVVAAASGGVVSSEIMPYFPSLARSTILVSYVIWGTGVPLACFIMALWLYRTAVYGVPAPAALPSVFLPLGPCGQGAFGIILLGRTIRKLAYDHGLALTIAPPSITDSNIIAQANHAIADAVYAGGLVTGMVLWGLGLCWYILAFAMIIDHLRKNRDFFHHSKFSVGLWALTFPLGVFATATTILASELNSPTFRVIGAFLSVQVTLHWIYVSVLTVYKVWNGTVFVAPELAGFKGDVPRRFGREQGKSEV